MASGAGSTPRGSSGRASAQDNQETTSDETSDETVRDDGDSRTLLVAALVGAAIGAGLGLLASQAFDEEPTMTRVVRSARKGAARRVRRGSAVASAASEAVGGFAAKARDAFEDALEREVKQLRRVARRQRRRLGF